MTQRRFFASERGYQGGFYAALQSALEDDDLLNSGRILEMEYQKSARHGIRQRPDVILHVPAEYSGKGVTENNVAVWALKRRASEREAQADFKKLDQMLRGLRYSVAVFVNIASATNWSCAYRGEFPDQLFAVAVQPGLDGISVKWSKRWLPMRPTLLKG